MNYSTITGGTKSSDRELQILYLDDCETDIASFQRRVKDFNKWEDNKLKNVDNVLVTPTRTHEEVWDSLVNKKNEKGFNVFVCDQNMPGKQGLDFIKLLIDEGIDICYVLYSAGVNVDGSIRDECARSNVLFFDKIEDLSTLLEKLIKTVIKDTRQENDSIRNIFSMEKIYYALAYDIIEDMKKVAGTDYRIRNGNKVYSPDDIIYELTNKTDFAFEYVMNYLEGLKFFKRSK